MVDLSYQLNIPYHEIWDYTFTELHYMGESIYMPVRISWEQTRWIAYYSVVAIAGSEHFKKPSDLFQLWFDSDIKQTVEDFSFDEEDKWLNDFTHKLPPKI